MTCGMVRNGRKAYKRANCQLRWKASDREPRLRTPGEQNRWHFLLSLLANRLIFRMPQGVNVTLSSETTHALGENPC